MCDWSLYSMCHDNMDIITVLRDMIDVRDINDEVEDVINDICLNWNVKVTFFFIVPLFVIVMCE